jgi:hypothetical protein
LAFERLILLDVIEHRNDGFAAQAIASAFGRARCFDAVKESLHLVAGLRARLKNNDTYNVLWRSTARLGR